MSVCWRIAICCSLMVASTRGESLPEQFTLGRYIPADAWMVVHGAHNPERAFIDDYWSDVWRAAMAIRLDRDLVMLVQHDAPPEQQARTLMHLDKTHEMLRRVAWRDLVAKEALFAESPAHGGLGYDYIFLTRGAAGSGQRNFQHIVELVKQGIPIVEKTFDIKILEHRRKTPQLELVALGAATGEAKRRRYTVFLVRRGDIIGAVVGGRSFKKVRKLLDHEGQAESMLDNPRFTKAVTEVRPPTDTIMFFDLRGFMSDLCHMCDAITVSIEKDGKKIRPDRGPDIVRHLMDEFNVIDYVVSSVRTEGLRETSHTVMRIQPDRRATLFARAMFERKPFERFDRFVPADAVSFSNQGLVDFELMYRFVVSAVVKHIPGGAEHVGKAKDFLAAVGFEPETDLFSWLSGEMVTVSLPARTPSSTGCNDFVWFVRTKKSDLAWRKLNTFIDFVNAHLQAHGQALMVQPADVGQDRFRRIVHPMTAVFLRPVVGVYDDWLVVGSSDDAVRRCLAVDAGEAPSITANPRFRNEGLKPAGPVTASSFRDMRHMGEQMAQGMAMSGMVGAMLGGQLDGDAPPEVTQLLTQGMTFGMKLAPVVRELDFYSSHASLTTFDGATRIETIDQITYVPPPRQRQSPADTAKAPRR